MDDSTALGTCGTDHFERRLDAQLSASRKEIERDPKVSLAIRKDRLSRLLELVLEGREALLAALEKDFGRRSPMESETIELLPLAMALRHAIGHLEHWMSYGKRSSHWATWPSKAAVDYVPLGVVGIMSPWNYPLMLSLGPCIGAMAAGNRVLIKPSEAVAHTNDVLEALVQKYFAPEELSVFQGGVPQAQAFAAAPWDHLVFTGSTAVGHKIMQSAAQQMVPVTLELGGACPAWLCPKAPLLPSLSALLRGKLVNAGQTCVAPNHLYCPASRLEEFLAQAPKVAQKMYPQGLADPHYTSLISKAHASKIQAWVDGAKASGARFVPLLEGGAPEFNCMVPACIVDPSPELPIACEEIFGPILVIHSYDDQKSVLPEPFLQELVARPHPLAVHIFSRDAERIKQVRALSRTGMVVVNGPLVHAGQDNLPFGGLGASGVGNYHGQEGFLRFSHHRSYYRQLHPHGIDLVFPPYGSPIKERVLSFLRRFG